jgi:hypothetical protein
MYRAVILPTTGIIYNISINNILSLFGISFFVMSNTLITMFRKVPKKTASPKNTKKRRGEDFHSG